MTLKEIDACVWQRTSGDNWNFGPMWRGLVRGPYAQVYFDEECDSEKGGWIWLTLGSSHKQQRGNALDLQMAAACVELALQGLL